MERGKVQLDNSGKYAGNYVIPMEKIDAAIKKATDKLAARLDVYAKSFPQNLYHPADILLYDMGENNSWICGMHTGTLVLAYELTKEQKFLDAALQHLPSYRKRIDGKIKMNDHDVGFFMSPSCVALYKLTGNEEARNIALEAAHHLYSYSYTEKGGFIQLSADSVENIGVRTIMDTLINSPLLLWAGQELGIQKYIDAAISQVEITDRCLMREDGSTYHHYMFDKETHQPLYGMTFQGNRDESTWSRGHAWGILGLPIVYEHTKEEKLLKMHHDLSYYMLNHLPEDNVPYWDFDFVSGPEARDSSAGVIASCGLMEMADFLPEDSEDRQIYRNAAAMMLDAVIDKYAGDIGREYDGLIWGVTGARKFDIIVEGCDSYGDYFYLEALLRYKYPDWKRLR